MLRGKKQLGWLLFLALVTKAGAYSLGPRSIFSRSLPLRSTNGAAKGTGGLLPSVNASTPKTTTPTLARVADVPPTAGGAQSAGTRVAAPSPEVFVANDGAMLQLFDNGVVLPLGWTGSSVRRRTGARFVPPSSNVLNTSPPRGILGSTVWPVGETSANPTAIGASSWGLGLREDVKRRWPHYKSDWFDGVKSPAKTMGATVFLYMAVLAPTIAFGGVMATVTRGALGPREVLVSCGVSGMLYSILAGQPMTFLAPTGLTLSFIGALYAWTAKAGVPFIAMYAWCGLWTSAMLLAMASFNASGLIKYCTRFTEDVFNALLALNFIMEGSTPIFRLINPALRGAGSSADALLALNAALLTASSCRAFAGATKTRYFTARTRALIADFGPAFVIVAMSTLLGTSSVRRLGNLARLNLKNPHNVVSGIGWSELFKLVDLGALSVRYRLLAAVPAMFLSMLFFLDQNITVRTVNSPQHRLSKGAAYHQDLAALGLITGLTSVLGLPWMCSATVQSLNHVRALSTYGENGSEREKSPSPPPSQITPIPKQPTTPPPPPQSPPPAPPAALKNGVASPPLSTAPAPPPSSPLSSSSELFQQQLLQQQQSPKRPQPPLADSRRPLEQTPSVSLTVDSEDIAPPVVQQEESAPPPSGGGATAVAKIEMGGFDQLPPKKAPATSVYTQQQRSQPPAGPAPSTNEVSSVVETRLTGFTVHALVLASLFAAPTLSEVPLAVVWGVFLFLGSKVIAGNQFIERMKALLVDTKRLEATRTVERTVLELGRAPVLRFTAVQAACLASLYVLKLNAATAMIFPSVIGVLLVIRAKVLPNIFVARELLTLDTALDI